MEYKLKTFYFTFGSNHKDRQGRSLDKKFTTVEARNAEEARAKMFECRGAKWAFMYTNEWQAGIQKYGLEHIEFSKLAGGDQPDVTNLLFT